MLNNRPLNPQDEMEIPDEQKDGSQQDSISLADFLPSELLLTIDEFLPSVKDSARLSAVNKFFHSLFQPQVAKKAAKDAAECVIYPTEESIEKLKNLLKECPPLLLHPMTVKNR